MKKKNILIIWGIVVVLILIAMAIFAFGSNKNVIADKIEITGSWKVVTYVNDNENTVDIIDNEYMVFEGETANDYRDNLDTPFASSKYVIENNELILPDLSRKYIIERKSDNYICLYEKQGIYMGMIRFQNKDMMFSETDPNLLNGKWNIVYRYASVPYNGDYLLFDDDTIAQYKANETQPAAVSKYIVENNHIIVSDWNKDMIIFQIASNKVIFVEISTDKGFIWELEKDK